MDMNLLMSLLGISSAQAATPGAGLQGGMPEPQNWLPPQAPQPVVAPVTPPMVQPQAINPAMVAGPPAPLPPMQSFEPTNPGNPMQMGPSEAYRSDPMGGPSTPYNEPYRSDPYQPQSLGASLDPRVPMPQPRPAAAGPGAAAAPAPGAGLLKALQGVKAPEAPQAQKVSTPAQPALRPIQSGGFAELMASLGIGPQQAFPGLKLPSTLGQALGGR